MFNLGSFVHASRNNEKENNLQEIPLEANIRKWKSESYIIYVT